ncbi:MAG: diacylglycerol/lipid kinase family protein [Pyrinomonadaceae bacterium]
MQRQESAFAAKSAASVEIIINAHSGWTDQEELRNKLESLFGASNLDARIRLARDGRELDELARRAVAGESHTIVAGGGDGTVSTIANAIVGTGKTLGILPLGTLNHFARDLHIPIELEEAARTVILGHTKQVDIGEVNGHFFINNTSLGLYPNIVRERQKNQRLGFGKWPAFVWAAITVLRRYPFLDVKLSVEGKEIAGRTPFVFIGNNEYQMERFHIGARNCLDGGRLSLYMTHRSGRLGLVWMAWRALFGGLRRDRDFTALCSREIWVETQRKVLRVAMDGEVRALEPPLHYRVHPRELRVLVPEETDKIFSL